MARKNPSTSTTAYYEALATTLAALRALKYVAWNAHWTSRNEWAYGDHLLYQRIYAGEEDNAVLDEMIDTLGEKLVYLKGDDFIQSPEIVEAYIGIIRSYGVAPTGRPVAAAVLEMVLICISHLKSSYTAGQGADMSLGMDDFLMASSNHLETFAYLLQQKLRR